MIEAQAHTTTDDQDASMDTILASIRRIIMEDESPPPVAATGSTPSREHHEEPDDDLLVLEPSMIVEKEPEMDELMARLGGSDKQSASDLAAALFDTPELPKALFAADPEPVRTVPVMVPQPAAVTVQPSAVPEPAATQEPLLAPSVSLAAAQSLASLQEAVRPEPPVSGELRLLRSGGPTIEDMVRDELRGQLKHWLDANLPSLVERLVAREIERLAGRG